ncbi:MAG: cytochrome c biogenesis CcdA family protein [Anaerolineales bacterium]
MERSLSRLKPSRTGSFILLVLAAVAGLVLAAYLLGLFSNRMARTDPAPAAASTVTSSAPVQNLTSSEIAELLLRSGVGPGGTELDILYAPAWYFDWSERSAPETAKPVLAFFVMETIHDGNLEEGQMLPLLQVEDQAYEPIAVQNVIDSPHHRTTQVLYAAYDPAGEALIAEESDRLTLIAPIDGNVSVSNTFTWDLPLPYGLAVLNDAAAAEAGLETTGLEPTMGGPQLTWPVLLAIMGGMLAALSPCLMQLAAYYAAVVASAGDAEGDLSTARSHLIRVGGFFVVGFVLVYTAGGAVAGFIGGSLQELELVQRWSRPASMAAGLILILLAFRVAYRARAPLVCRLPLRPPKERGSSWADAAAMGATFAFGCLTCFSATVLSALLVYAGSTGSPALGASLLLLFSVSVGVIFLLAAGLVSNTAPIMGWLQRAQPVIGGVSALVMAVFGVMMLTYRFHVFSGTLLRWFSLG